MRLLLVANPASGNGASLETVSALEKDSDFAEALRKVHDIDSAAGWTRVITDKQGAWRAAMAAELDRGDVAVVVGVGGDGTFGELAGTVQDWALSRKQAALPDLCFVPAGRGNDLVRALCGYRRKDGPFLEWVRRSRLHWSRKPFDVATANGKLFVNMASLGYGGRVVERAHNRRFFGCKAIWAKTSFVYQVEGALALFGPEQGRCRVTVDGRPSYEGPFFGAFVGNGPANGSGLFWCSQARTDDGLLDGLVFPKPGVMRMASAIAAVKKHRAPAFRHALLRGAELALQFEVPTPIELDGDYSGLATEYVFRALPGRFKLWQVGSSFRV